MSILRRSIIALSLINRHNLAKAINGLRNGNATNIRGGISHLIALREQKGRSPGRLSRSRFVAERWRRILALFTIENLQKVGSSIFRGNISVAVSAFRNLVAQQDAMAIPVAELGAGGIFETYPPRIHPAGVPLVTVVIPCFNYGRFIGEAVDSVLAQSFRDLEVIVVDGGSSDRLTPDLVRSLAGPQVRVFLREGRHLAGDNRNFGIAQCKSPYIVCLDADDTLHPTYIEKALFLAEHLGFDVISCGLRLMGSRSGTVGILPYPALSDLVLGNHVYTCALFHRHLLEKVGGYFDYGLGAEHAAEDWDFWIRIAATGARFGNISGEFLLNYRVHKTASLSSGPGVPDIETQRQRILARNAKLIDRDAHARSKAAKRRALSVDNACTALTRAMLRVPPVHASRTILIAIPFFLVGGAERLLAQVAQELVDCGWRVVVVSTVFQELGPTDAIEWFESVTTEVYALPRFLHPTQWTTFVEYLFTSRRFQALLIAGSRFFYGLVPYLSNRHPELAIMDFLFNAVGHAAPHQAAMPLLTGVLCENAEVRDWCLAVGWSPNEIELVQSMIDVGSYAVGPRSSDLVDRFSISPDEIVVGFSGRMSEEKAPEVFVDVAGLCRSQQRLRFIMTGGGRISGEIERRVARAPAGTRIDVCGIVDDVRPYLTLYDIFVLPSRVDGRPIAVLEAMASGCAIIASRVGGLPDLVHEGTTGYLVPPGDAEAIANHLMALADDPDTLQRLKAAARKHAEQNLDRASADAPYAKAIEAAVERRKAHISHAGLSSARPSFSGSGGSTTSP